MKFIVGIDEAGRGPLAGPVAVGVVKIPSNFDKKFFNGIKDSKKLSAEKRESWFALAKATKKKDELDFAVALISNTIIDSKGISHAIRLGIKKCLDTLVVSKKDSKIFLDGSLKAPKEFIYQETIIKGDEKVPIISLASICAKVTRDRFMLKLAKKYPKYGFEKHKGYGTLLHRRNIKKYGSDKPHRQTYLKHLTKG